MVSSCYHGFHTVYSELIGGAVIQTEESAAGRHVRSFVGSAYLAVVVANCSLAATQFGDAATVDMES
jgi:hypothetical protein